MKFSTARPFSTAVDKRDSLTAAGFTLIELLTVIAIIGVLTAIIISSVGYARSAAAKARETIAARSLMQAYLLFPADNRGVLLPQTDGKGTATSETGSALGAAATSAMDKIAGTLWPNRLRPYLGDRFKDTMYVNEQAEYYSESNLDAYTLGRSPTFGMNGRFVGGDGSMIQDSPIKRLMEATNPSKLIAFIGAHERTLNDKSGFWRVQAPVYGWPSTDLTTIPDQKSQDQAYGWVAFRWSGRATVVYLDGHVELQTCAELRDMRRWSDAAYRTDNASYVPAPIL